MSDLKAAIRAVRAYRDQYHLAMDLERALTTIDTAPHQIANLQRQIAGLSKEVADLEDAKDKIQAVVSSIKSETVEETAKLRADHAVTVAEIGAKLESEMTNAAKVRQERRDEMRAEEQRHLASLNAIKDQITKAKADAKATTKNPTRQRRKAPDLAVEVTNP